MPGISQLSEVEIDALLPKGLEAAAVCQEYFEACESDQPDRWLACLHLEQREKATSQKPGPFAVCSWELGRDRVSKYMVKYSFTGQVGEQSYRNSEPCVELKYQPLYGPVPGYTDGAPLGEPITLSLQRQGGPRGEWRVTRGSF